MSSTKGLLFAALIVSVVVSAVLLPVADLLQALFDWVNDNRSVSWLVFIIFYILFIDLIRL